MPHDASPPDREVWDRNVRLAEIGEAGQRRLNAARAVVVGAGGLGSPAILYMAAAGVGRLTIVESDLLEPSNLNRQIIHRAYDLGRPKAESAREAVLARWPSCNVSAVTRRLDADTAADVLDGADIVLDCTDNFPTRFIIADTCLRLGLPLVTAGALRFGGQVLSVVPREGSPCLRCLLPEAPPPDESPPASAVGILGAAAGVLGALEAAEAVKVLLGIGRNLAHALLVYDGLAGTFRLLNRARDPACPACGRKP
jgi:molybdopterin/thiamine biosynthesis adenylyltransferase